MPRAPRALAETLKGSPDLQPEVLTDSGGGAGAPDRQGGHRRGPGLRRRVEYRFDPERPESRTARLQVDDALQRGVGPAATRSPSASSAVSEPGSRYVDFVVPGLLGMNLMGSGIWGLGFSIVDARRKKLLKRMIATPMSRTQFLASFVLSRLTMLVLEVGALVGFALLVFGVPVRGSPLSLLAICLLSALAFGSLGLLLASRTRTIEGASGLMNLVMLPMWIFSGRLLLRVPLPRRAAAVHPGASAHRGERRAPGEHAGRRRLGSPGARARHRRRVAGDQLRAGGSAVPLALAWFCTVDLPCAAPSRPP